jgi:SAM-dependent methyltransferase
MQKTGLEFPLVEAPSEAVPLPDASFDLAVSEYGASLWADPYAWIPEAARLLRPGGQLVFLTNSTLVYLTAPDSVEEMVGDELLRDQFGMYRIRWDGATGIEFHLPHGEWIALLGANGLEVEALHEPQPGASAENPGYYDFVDLEWARRWPADEIWVARRR